MSNIITSEEVFEFMKSASDVATNKATMITNLITREEKNLEIAIGRKVQATAFTDVLLQPDLNCQIFKDKIFLSGQYRDTYSISEIIETGQTLTASTDYNDGGDYYLDIVKGVIIRINSWWQTEQLGIKMTGSMGIGAGTTRADLKQTLIEMVAAKSGLWKSNVETEDGPIETIRTNISQDAKDVIKKYTIRDW